MKQENYIIATIKPWNIKNFKQYFGKRRNFHLITKKEDLTLKRIQAIRPRYIFFPHWSWIVPEEIWSSYECVTFHETDLPYGRGGSPIQNLLARGHTRTKISALKIEKGIDTGDIYCKRPLSLHGTAQEIFERASKEIFLRMIPFLIGNEPVPKKQKGKSVVFSRRKPEEGSLLFAKTATNAYNLIRMLDAETYPKAFLELDSIRVEFSRVQKKGKAVEALATFYEK